MSRTSGTMREAFIAEIFERMSDQEIFFLSADFGSIQLDKIRAEYPDRFINVGIAEQNLINIASGLALEGNKVFAYAIAPFLAMRAFEQIRNNLSLMFQLRQLNVNLVGVGAGLSYDISGPTHHCLEDISVIRTLPNIIIFSPGDWVTAEAFVEHCLKIKQPKYLRFDSKPLPNIYEPGQKIDFNKGFHQLTSGTGVCLVTTGYMTHQAIAAVKDLKEQGIEIGHIDLFMLRPFDETALFKLLKEYDQVVTCEEAFINKGGLDSIIVDLLVSNNYQGKFSRIGISDQHIFKVGSREYLHGLNRSDPPGLVGRIKELMKK